MKKTIKQNIPIRHSDIDDMALRRKIKHKEIVLAGNLALKIFGRLGCRSGKRMKKQNRVFFSTTEEAISYGFRPCGHCMKSEYTCWKLGNDGTNS